MDSYTDIVRKYFISDILSTYNAIPSFCYLTLAISLIIGTIAFGRFFEPQKAFRFSMRMFLLEYLLLLFSSTLIFREPAQVSKCNYSLFWSYEAIIQGDHSLIIDNTMNILAFIPVGFFLCGSVAGIKWKTIALLGCCCSLLIEFIQLQTARGFSEFDDVIHNTLGCMIGYGSFCLVRLVYEIVSKRRMAVL